MNPALKYQILQEHENILKQKKIKILPYIHKTVDNGLKLNDDKDKSLFKKLTNKEIEKTENIFGLNNSKNKKLYLLRNHFEYPNKNFPESRSEFSFSQEGKEFILYGGYNSVTIKNMEI
jgi:hypothetical protein